MSDSLPSKRLTLAEARHILDSPPTILDHFFFKDRYTWIEYQKITGPGALPERYRTRLHSIHGVENWRAG